MYFTIVFLLFVYLITLQLFFSVILSLASLELMGRFLVVLIPVFIGVISNFEGFSVLK